MLVKGATVDVVDLYVVSAAAGSSYLASAHGLFVARACGLIWMFVHVIFGSSLKHETHVSSFSKLPQR